MGKVVKGVAKGLGVIPSAITGGFDAALQSLMLTASVAIGGPSALLAVAAQALAPGPRSIKQQGAGIAINSIQPMVNAPIIYGRARVGGPIIFYHARQVQEGGEPVDYRYFTIAISAGELEEFQAL